MHALIIRLVKVIAVKLMSLPQIFLKCGLFFGRVVKLLVNNLLRMGHYNYKNWNSGCFV